MEKQKKNRAVNALAELKLSAVICLVAIAMFLGTWTFQLSKLLNTITSAFWPRVLSCLLFFCSGWLFVSSYKKYQSCTAEEKAAAKIRTAAQKESVIRIAVAVTDLLIAAALLKKLGFMLTMPFMMFIMFLAVEKKEKWNIKLYLLLSIVLPVALFFLFYYVFSQLLPMGILKPWLSYFL